MCCDARRCDTLTHSCLRTSAPVPSESPMPCKYPDAQYLLSVPKCCRASRWLDLTHIPSSNVKMGQQRRPPGTFLGYNGPSPFCPLSHTGLCLGPRALHACASVSQAGCFTHLSCPVPLKVLASPGPDAGTASLFCSSHLCVAESLSLYVYLKLAFPRTIRTEAAHVK